MKTLCVILARAGSKGLPGKNAVPVAGRPMLLWTLDHARAAGAVLDHVVLSTDGALLGELGRGSGIDVIQRPADLATDTSTVDDAVRHTVETVEAQRGEVFDAVVILYANIPVRPDDLIERAVQKLSATGCDSVQSVAPVGKNHPYWMKTLGGQDGDVLEHYQPNNVYRRQELPPVYQLDGGIIAVTRTSLFTIIKGEPHAFLGANRRAVVTESGAVLDVDETKDLRVAEAVLEDRLDADPEPETEEAPEAALSIAGRPIGEDYPVYVIAEIGVNHDGRLDRALELTRVAKATGADAVKLQLFSARHLLSAEAELAGYQEGMAQDPFELLDALQLGVEDMLQVKALAHELGLGFVVTPFSLENTPDLERIDPDAVKIASPDCVNTPLLRAVRALDKPMLISTGAASMDELWEMNATGLFVDAVMMQCVSSYPVPVEQAGLGGILDMLQFETMTSGRPVLGYSDHTDDVVTGVLAVSYQADVIERHLTYDTKASGPDHAASLDPEGFTRYVRMIRTAEQSLRLREHEGKGVQPCEADVRRVSRQSLCAVSDLPTGHTLALGDLTVKRPGTGIPAARLGDAIGRTLNRAVRANDLLHAGDIDLPSPGGQA